MGFHHTQGEVVALDRIRNKIDRIHQNAQMLNLCSVKAFCFNSTRAVSSDPAQSHEGTVTCPCPSLIIPMDPPGDDSSASVLSRASLPAWEFRPGPAGRSLQWPWTETQHGEHLESQRDLLLPASAAQLIPRCRFDCTVRAKSHWCFLTSASRWWHWAEPAQQCGKIYLKIIFIKNVLSYCHIKIDILWFCNQSCMFGTFSHCLLTRFGTCFFRCM